MSRAAISMLAASRLTSHSHGPGSVSSKSLTSNTSRRSGEANTPKFDRCASPQHCTFSPDRGVAGEIVRHDHRRAAIERERRDEHPAVADRHQLRHARLGLTLEQLDRIGAVRRGLERRVARARHLGPRRLAPRDPLGHRQMRHRGRRPFVDAPRAGRARALDVVDVMCPPISRWSRRSRRLPPRRGACRGAFGRGDQRADDPQDRKEEPIQNIQNCPSRNVASPK